MLIPIDFSWIYLIILSAAVSAFVLVSHFGVVVVQGDGMLLVFRLLHELFFNKATPLKILIILRFLPALLASF